MKTFIQAIHISKKKTESKGLKIKGLKDFCGDGVNSSPTVEYFSDSYFSYLIFLSQPVDKIQSDFGSSDLVSVYFSLVISQFHLQASDHQAPSLSLENPCQLKFT